VVPEVSSSRSTRMTSVSPSRVHQDDVGLAFAGQMKQGRAAGNAASNDDDARVVSQQASPPLFVGFHNLPAVFDTFVNPGLTMS